MKRLLAGILFALAGAAWASEDDTRLRPTTVLPRLDNYYDLGSPAYRWRNGYFGGSLSVGNMATQAEMEAGSSLTAFVSPGRAQYHPGSAKAWVVFRGTGTVAILNSYNVSSITDSSAGNYVVNFSTPFSSGNYACTCTASLTAAVRICGQAGTPPTASAWELVTFNVGAALADADRVFVSCFGDQ